MSKVDALIADGLTQVNKPYAYGEEGPNSFDCSGLIQFLFKRQGISLPRTAAQQQAYVTPIAASDARPGDLVYWGSPATHTALYLGNNKILSAPHAGARVHVTNLYGNPSFGRVPALSGIGGSVSGAVDATAASLGLGDWAGSARKLGIEFMAVGVGAALVGLGIYRALIGPALQSKVETLKEVL